MAITVNDLRLTDVTIYCHTKNVVFFKNAGKTGLLTLLFESVLTVFTITSLVIPQVEFRIISSIIAISLQTFMTLLLLDVHRTDPIWVKIDKDAKTVAIMRRTAGKENLLAEIQSLSSIRRVLVEELTYRTATRGGALRTQAVLDTSLGIKVIFIGERKDVQNIQKFLSNFLWGSELEKPEAKKPQDPIESTLEKIRDTIQRINPGKSVGGNSKLEEANFLTKLRPELLDSFWQEAVEQQARADTVEALSEWFKRLSVSIERAFIESRLAVLPEKLNMVYTLVLLCLARAARILDPRNARWLETKQIEIKRLVAALT
jgi:hypothetical protein